MATVGNVSETNAEITFLWSIPKFFSTVVGNYYRLKSPAVQFSGRSWNLLLYPNGTTDENRGWISLYLRMQLLHRGDKTVTFSLDIKKRDGSLAGKNNSVNTFTKDFPDSGWEQFLKLDDLKKQSSEWALADVLVVSCRIVNVETHIVERIPQPSKHMELENLSSDFNDLLNSEKYCDATLKVNGKEFHVHKAVLAARSLVFSAMFDSPMSEKETGIVDIPDCDPEYFGDFLKYMYTGKLEYVSSRNSPHLYVTADKYDLQNLKLYCLKYIKRNLHMENFWDVVNLADLHGENELMSSAHTFFNVNAADIFQRSEWVMLMDSNSLLANKLLKGMFSGKIAESKNGEVKEYPNKRPRHPDN